MAFEANDSGDLEVFVRPFPEVTAGRWQMSRGGGTEPVWARDGQELFYRTGTRVMRIAVGDGSPATWGSPTEVFDRPYFSFPFSRTYDVAPDGRLLMISVGPTGSDPGSTNVVVVEHWSTELNELVPSGN